MKARYFVFGWDRAAVRPKMILRRIRERDTYYMVNHPFMKILPSRVLLPAFLAAVALLATARADLAPVPTPATTAAAQAEPTLSFDFPGGTLGDLIALAEKASGAVSLNVIGEKAALATEIQAFTVKNADRDAVLRAIGQLLRGRGVRVEQAGAGFFIVSSEGSKDRRGQLNAEEVAVLRKAKSQTIFDSFQLGSYIDDQQSVDNIVDVIRSAWTLNPAHEASALQIKFHPATKLLLVSGPPDAIEMTRQVIRSLHENRKPRNGPPPPSENK